MKILHAITGLPVAAGTTTFVVEAANELARRGHAVTVAVYCEPAPHDRALFVPGVEVTSIPKVLERKGGFDVVHLHALWSYDLHRISRWAARHSLPVVWSPHGALSPWAMHNNRLRKLPFWLLRQRPDLRRAERLHATSVKEEEWIRSLGFVQPVVLAPLGTKVRAAAAMMTGEETLLFVGRLHPVKGLENALRAWAAARPLGWRFRLVGPDQDGYRRVLEELAESLGIAAQVDFAGPRYAQELEAEYLRSTALVLPSFTENFGATVADALACGKPVVVSRQAPWSEVEERQCGFWVDNSVPDLAAAFTQLSQTSPAERHAMGERGRQLIAERYSWPAMAERLEASYRQLGE